MTRMGIRMPGLVHVVADYGPDDGVFDSLSRRLSLAAPDAEVMLTQVAACDSLAAGFCVASLALDAGLTPRVVVHDVGARLAAGAEGRECAGWTADGVTIVGPDTGWSWSFVAAAISGPCYLELPTGSPSSRSPEVLAAAIVRGVTRHPHAVCAPVPPKAVPPLPGQVVAYADRAGNLGTTISDPPAPTGERVQVRIGDALATAVVSDGTVPVHRGELVLGPASSRWRPTAEGGSPFLELSIPGGSAADLFHSPSTGIDIAIQRR